MALARVRDRRYPMPVRKPEVVDDPSVPGVVRISAASDPAGPRIGILGAIHGNERCGLEAIRRLRRDAEAGELPIAHGTLVLIHGNPGASEDAVRFTEGGEDINRILDYRFVDELPRERWSPEHHRALALRPVLEELDFLLDLHSATEETLPFAIVNDVPGALDLASQLGIRYVTRAWNELADRVTIGVLARRGRPGISVECGQHEASVSREEALRLSRRFLLATGLVPGDVPAPVETTFLEVEEVLKKPSEGFRFATPLRGLDELPAGTLIGSDGTTELRIAEPAVALLPNDRVEVGDDVLYLARPRSVPARVPTG